MTDPGDIFSRPPAPPEPPPRRSLLKRPWFILLAAFLVLVGVVGTSINSIMRALLHSRAEVIVPRLEGKSLADALAAASPLDLSLQQESTEFDESLPAGTIVRQHPPPGMQVRAGRAIRVVVSKGGEVVFVPLVVGKSLPEAQSVLASDRLQLGVVTESYASDAPKGMVLEQNPSSGTVVTRGALVDVDVSRGLPPAGLPILPDFTGQPVERAQQWATDVNASVNIEEDPNAVGMSGSVLRQQPAPGQPLLEGETIRLAVVPVRAGARLTFRIPENAAAGAVRILARDADGERKIYEGRHAAGAVVEVPVRVPSTTRFRIYVDDVLQDERVVEP